MVCQLNVDGGGNVVLEDGKVVGSYKIVGEDASGLVAEFRIRDEFMILQMRGNLTEGLPIGYVQPAEVFDIDPPYLVG